MNARYRTRIAMVLATLLPVAVGHAQTATPIHGATGMQAMDMNDNAAQGMLLFDQLEAYDGRGQTGQHWDIEGFYGNDIDKLWLRSEGDVSHGRLDDGDLELLWNRAVSTFWNTQWGLRQDVGEGPHRSWMAFGVEGLAPYWVELEATGYVSPSGRMAARARAEYTLRFTQRLILQPEWETNLYSRDDPAQRIGDGLSNMQLALRLRYEITRDIAPYVGIVWERRFGATASYAGQVNQPRFDQQFVAGIRLWF